jgi:hypothetical protein
MRAFRSLARALRFSALLAAAASCTQSAGAPGQIASRSAARSELERFPAALELLESAAPIHASADTLQLQAPVRAGAGPWQSVSQPLLATVSAKHPSSFRIGDGAASVRVHRSAGFGERFVIDGAAVAHVGERTSGAFLFATGAAVEDLWLLRAPQLEAAYEVELPARWSMRKGSDAMAELLDGAGRAQYRVTADRAWDSSGTAVPVALEIKGSRVVVSVQGAVSWPVVVDPAWTTASSPIVLRTNHTATLLGSGDVLLAGGNAGSPSTERFHPSTGQFTAAASMSTGRAHHTATLLQSGKVLVVGGRTSQSAFIDTAELYDPESDTFTPTAGKMLTARSHHAATLLASGKVLIVGGDGTSGAKQAELYDPATDTFAATGSLHSDASGPAVQLPSGKVFVQTGSGSDAPCDLFDPSADNGKGAFSLTSDAPGLSLAINGAGTLLRGSSSSVLMLASMCGYAGDDVFCTAAASLFDADGNAGAGAFYATGSLAEGREAPSATLLPSGLVLVSGGNEKLKGAELYDAATGTFSPAGDTEQKHSGQTATLLPSGNVLVLGGQASVDVYVPPGAFHTVAGKMTQGRSGHKTVLLRDGRLLLTGGYNEVGKISTAELFDPVARTFSATGEMTAPRHNQTMTLLQSGKVLVAGGSGLSSAELYDPSSGSFAPVTAPMSQERSGHAAVLLPSGKVLLAGGVDTDTAELFDPQTGSFTLTEAMKAQHLGPGAVLLPSGRVFVVGTTTADLYDPSTGQFAPAAPPPAKRDGWTASLLGTGHVWVGGSYTNSAAVYDPEIGTWKFSGPAAEVWGSSRPVTLPWGDVLVTGGAGTELQTAHAELYTAIGAGGVGSFAPVPNMTLLRTQHAASLLVTGEVLITGGYSGPWGMPVPPYDTAETWSNWSEPSAWRPQLTAAPEQVVPGSTVALAGQNLRGPCEGSSGATASSPADHPVALWMPESGQGSVQGTTLAWTDTTATWKVPATGLHGHGWLRVAVNGTVSNALSVEIQAAPVATACQFASECSSGFCVDGLCCDRSCTGLCEACTAAKKGSGADGVCGEIPEGKDPNDMCAKGLGAKCGAAQECSTGFCEDGVCCDAVCAGVCQACNVEGNFGKCIPVIGAPPPSRDPCPMDDTKEPCSQRLCDGKDPGKCQGYVVTPCRQAACSAGLSVGAASCDGQGHCPAASPRACDPFVCKGVACVEACVTDADCVDGYRCNDGICETGCDGDHTVTTATGSVDCAPYRCSVAACKTTCTSINDCAAPFVCGLQGQCISASAAGADADGSESGCGCRAQSRGGSGTTWAGLLVLVCLLHRRRSAG